MKLKNNQLLCGLLLGSTFIVGCQSTSLLTNEKREPKEAIAELTPQAKAPTLPDSVSQELLADVPTPERFVDNEPRFDVAANDVDVKSFFAGLVNDTPLSVAVHPDVTGRISLNLKDVTLSETLHVLRTVYNFDVQQHGRVLQVMPATIRTETIPVNYLMLKRIGLSTTSITAGGVSQYAGNGNGQGGNGQNGFGQTGNNSAQNGMGNQGGLAGNNANQLNGSNIQSRSEADFWQDLEKALKAMVGAEASKYVVVSPQAGLVSVRALPSEIAAIKQFLQQSETSLQRQVILETKIIEVTLNDEYQQGVNWTKALGHIGSTDFNFTSNGVVANNAISASLGGVSNIVFRNQDFAGVVNLLQTQGNVQVLSSPRVTATNNQKAVIKVGQDEYFVTEVSNTTVTGTATTSTPEIQLTPFFSGIALDVTPQIDAQGGVTLHVHPSVTETAEQEKIVTLNNERFVLPLAQSNIRESDTVIRANTGEIVVIGGLMQTTMSESDSKTPLLGDIPVLGHLFKTKNQKEVKKELVILLRPVVVNADTWRNELQRSADMVQGWYKP